MKLGSLTFLPIADRLDLVAEPVMGSRLPELYVSEIDPALSDTAAFCAAYDIGMETSANCVIVEVKRADKIQYAACVVLAINKADINGIVRRHLEARKISFAPMDKAVPLTGMEYGGITPVGLPSDWPIIIDEAVVHAEKVIIGSGVRKSKLLLPGKLLAALPNTVVLPIAKVL